MARYRSLDEILEEDDELDLLQVTLRARATRSPERERDAQLIGEVNDFVLDHNGSVAAVIVGVGGFLGIGQKNVAINWEELQLVVDANGNQRLVANMTREQLENSADFERSEKVPKDDILTCSPRTSASDICWITDSTSCADSLRDRPTSRNTASLRSIRVSVFPDIYLPLCRVSPDTQDAARNFPSQYQALAPRSLHGVESRKPPENRVTSAAPQRPMPVRRQSPRSQSDHPA